MVIKREDAVAEAKRISNKENCPVYLVEAMGCAVGDTYFPIDLNENVE